MLGAGYDSRAYRFAEALRNVKVFEVDHPASLEDKKEKLKKSAVDTGSVIYVPVDFNTDSLEDKLKTAGYDAAKKTLFVWEGVTYYLEPAAVDATLKFIAETSGRGSSVIFDYTYTWVISGDCSRGEIVRMKRYRRFTNESLTFGIDEGTIKSFLETRGFSDVVNATSGDFKALYFSNADKEVAPIYAIAYATVKRKS